MDITPFRTEYLQQAAALFVEHYRQQRKATPILPDRMEDTKRVSDLLASMFNRTPGVLAIENGQLVGYLGWYVINRFRNTERRTAYCPEWAHAVTRPGIYLALYRAASSQWAAAGCNMHAISLLADDLAAQNTWFWNGFGLSVVDAVRPLTSLKAPVPSGFEIRKASRMDVDALAQLEAEHWQHYIEAPVFMNPEPPDDAAAYTEFLSNPKNSAYLAFQNDQPAAYMRFESSSYGAADIVNAETTVACTAAFARPEHRGRGLSGAILDTAMTDFRAQKMERCTVDFESFNPEAAAFWTRYFQPVCLSLFRVPER